ncbi:MAG: bifunctional UDP-N-acetylglucosamine diphosphorylase/glucosamine-1-phosphate N-acetyltransferase GlmU [Bryobacteraceae bacterium]|jgi:bifunctional UDP-N-acetylglucosamine pyrophosphorylase/glucosamine-1-phosphate N-acetyltransferase
MESPISIVILAAGLGTRMKSKQAKVLHHAGGVPLIEHVVGTALALAPPEGIFVVVGRQAEQVQAAVAGHGVQFVLQAEQKGTGHALLACRERLAGRPGHLLVLYGDCPLLTPGALRQLVEAQERGQFAATVITTLVEDPTGYGRILRDASGDLSAIVEQKAATPDQLAVREINSGIYCFRADLLWKHIVEIEPNNVAREYYLTDIVEIFRRAGHFMQPLVLADSTEVLGINSRAELALVDRILRERKARQLMLDGVTIEKPETVTIDAGVTVGIDTIVGPFAQLLGRTVIGEDCRIGACSIVRDSRLAADVQVAPFTMVDSCELETGVRVGPFARLRMGAHLETGAVVGNFVEVKKSRLGAKAKSQHLAYLGDASIGKGVNVGAGTITCNYDGERKHPTTIGDGAFIGSNSTLVAPLEIGAGSYVAAGSVITKNVPPDALALGRARQAIKEQWAKKRRALAEPPSPP